jgi:hypothetical protein
MSKEKEKIKISDVSEFFEQSSEEKIDKFFEDEEEDIGSMEEENEEEGNEEDPDKKGKKKDPKKSKKNEEEEIFNNEEEENKEKSSEEITTISDVNIVMKLKERGLIDFDLEEGQELTEEEASDLLEESLEAAVQQNLADIFKDLHPIVKDFNKFVSDGGDPMEFIKTHKNHAEKGLSLGMDLSKDETQEKVLRILFAEEGLDDDLIDSQIDFLKDNGKLKNLSEKKYQTWSKSVAEEQKKLLEKQEEDKKDKKEKEKKYRRDLADFIASNDTVGNLKLNKGDKNSLTSYIMDRNVKLQNGQFISSFYADLNSVLGNTEAIVQLAKLLKLRDKAGKFSFKEIEKDIETSVTKKIKDKINNEDNHTPSNRQASGFKKKSLVDFLS